MPQVHSSQGSSPQCRGPEDWVGGYLGSSGQTKLWESLAAKGSIFASTPLNRYHQQSLMRVPLFFIPPDSRRFKRQVFQANQST